MEFIKIESKSGVDINAILRCEYCGAKEMVYGKDTDEWYWTVNRLHCIKCGKSTEQRDNYEKRGSKINAKSVK